MIYRKKVLGDILCHYNQYHDPRTGQFTSKNGGPSVVKRSSIQKREASKQKYEHMVQNMNTAYDSYMQVLKIFNSGFHFNNPDKHNDTQSKIKEMNYLLKKARMAKKEYDLAFESMNESGANLDRFEDIDKLESICDRIAKTINNLNNSQPVKHSDYLMHFNPNHDPDTGKFTDRKGSFISDAAKQKIKSVAKYAGKMALKGAVVAASVATGRLAADVFSGAATALGAKIMGDILGNGIGAMGMGIVNEALGTSGVSSVNTILSNPMISSMMSNPQEAMNILNKTVTNPENAAALQDTINQVLIDYGSQSIKHDDESEYDVLCHFNPNHDPRTGMFTSKIGSVTSLLKKDKTVRRSISMGLTGAALGAAVAAGFLGGPIAMMSLPAAVSAGSLGFGSLFGGMLGYSIGRGNASNSESFTHKINQANLNQIMRQPIIDGKRMASLATTNGLNPFLFG